MVTLLCATLINAAQLILFDFSLALETVKDCLLHDVSLSKRVTASDLSGIQFKIVTAKLINPESC